jgi:hypothetical protein
MMARFQISRWLQLCTGLLAVAAVLFAASGVPSGAQGTHTHAWSSAPLLSTVLTSNPPFFHVGSGLASDYQPTPGCIVELVKDPNSGWVDRDTCANPGCSFTANEAPNALQVDRWEASAGDGQFGSLDANGQFTSV